MHYRPPFLVNVVFRRPFIMKEDHTRQVVGLVRPIGSTHLLFFNFRSVPFHFNSIDRKLNRKGMGLEPERNGNGTGLEREWIGTGMEWEWNRNGRGMEQKWNKSSMDGQCKLNLGLPARI